MKQYTLFFSWQSDDNKAKKTLDTALSNAIDAIKTEYGVEIVLDHSTLGESGMPTIDQTILDKIDKCDIFLADITPVCNYSKTEGNGVQVTKQVPNANVLLELGYAMSAVGFDYTICVAHQGNWVAKDLPFDLNHKSIYHFTSSNCNLKDAIYEVIKYIQKNGRHRHRAMPYLIHRIKTISEQIKEKYFSKPYDYYEGKAVENSTVFFSQRLASAFPGVRGLKVYTKKKDIKKHLTILLKEPLHFNEALGYDATTDPIWYFRGSSGLPIYKFKHIGGRRYLIGWDELKIKKIVVFIDSGRYYGSYLYIETYNDKPCGVYRYSKEKLLEIQSSNEDYGEEYAVFSILHLFKKKVSKQEEDDGSTKVLGRIVRIPRDKKEIRIRHINKYNLILAAKDSAFNCERYLQTSERYFSGLLEGSITHEEFKNYMWGFPKKHW